MEVQKEIEDKLKEKGIKGNFKTMVGGSPVSQAWANKIYADGYSEDAMSCCKLAESFMQNKSV
jgi:dimethylamine corrinoid protein